MGSGGVRADRRGGGAGVLLPRRATASRGHRVDAGVHGARGGGRVDSVRAADAAAARRRGRDAAEPRGAGRGGGDLDGAAAGHPGAVGGCRRVRLPGGVLPGRGEAHREPGHSGAAGRRVRRGDRRADAAGAALVDRLVAGRPARAPGGAVDGRRYSRGGADRVDRAGLRVRVARAEAAVGARGGGHGLHRGGGGLAGGVGVAGRGVDRAADRRRRHRDRGCVHRAARRGGQDAW